MIGEMRASNRRERVFDRRARASIEDAGSRRVQKRCRQISRVALTGATLAGRSLFPPCAQMGAGPQHLLLIGLAILGKRFHRSREPVLLFTEEVGWRVGIADMFGRFKRRLRPFAVVPCLVV
jgi:hypothetical protein